MHSAYLEYFVYVLSKAVFHMSNSESVRKRCIFVEMETFDKVVDIDRNLMDPQCCGTIAYDIYKNLRVSEVQHTLLDNIECAVFSYFVNVLCLPKQSTLSILNILFNGLFNLFGFQANKSPSTDFMEMIQKEINASMRAVLIDWLVEVICGW